MTNAHAFARPLACLVVASAAATARAQSPAFEWETSVAWPSSLGDPGAIGRVVAGDADGDQRPDVFARGAPSPGTPDGSFEVLFVYAPWFGTSAQKLGIRSLDFDFQKGNPGKLAFTKVSGLWTLTWNPSANPPFTETQIASGAPWAGAKKVRCGDLDDSVGPDYIGVAPDGHTLVLRRTNSGGTTTVLVDVVDQVVDLFALQWIQGNAQEVAVLTTDDLYVYDGTGTLLDTFTPPTAGAGVIAPVRFGTNGPDRVAWVSLDSSGETTRFDLVRRATPQLEGPLTPQYDDVIAMATADVDNDGDEDLVMTHRADRLAWLYKSGFVDGNSRVYHPNRSQPVYDPRLDPDDVLPNSATFVFRDLGNDHRPDLLLPVEIEGVTTFEVLSTVNRADALSEEVFFSSSNHPFQLNFPLDGTCNTWFSIKTTDYVPEATDVQVVVWNQPSALDPMPEFAADKALYFDIDVAQQSDPDSAWQVYGVDLNMVTGWTPCNMPVRWIEVRFVQRDGEEIVDSWPTYTCAIITREDDYCAIDNGSTINVEMPLSPPTNCTNNPGTCNLDDGSWPGDAITRRRKPDPPPGVIPKVQIGENSGGTIPAPL